MFLSAEAYRETLKSVPILCVDLVIKRNGQYLLLKRADEPEKGKWCVPGGRVLLSETIEKAVKRKAFLETGLDFVNPKFLGYFEGFFDKSAFGVPCHTVSLVFEGGARGEVKINSESSEWAWCNCLPTNFIVKG